MLSIAVKWVRSNGLTFLEIRKSLKGPLWKIFEAAKEEFIGKECRVK